MIAISYELNEILEPGTVRAREQSHAPSAILSRIDGGWSHDRFGDSWTRFGKGSPPINAPAAGTPSPNSFQIGPLESATGRDRFVASVQRAKTYIRDGDVYQVNLTHPLRGSFEGSTRGLFVALAEAARPWHGAYIEVPSSDTCEAMSIASVSPELFLEYDPCTRLVRARPMKGTIATTGASDSPEVLDRSEKDRAELNMIIDLMRNDLGRTCRLGSVRVEEARSIETHTNADGHGLLQATGSVTGVLRDGLSPLDLLWSAFPPGSVTGAPKIRAMQIIRELETEPRRFYCGAIGFLGDDGRMMLNVAIRTATISGDRIEYPVGAGIVADSDPDAEWRETIAKAWPIIRVSQTAGQ